MLIACGIRTKIHSPHPFRKHVQGLFEYPNLFIPRRDVPVSKLAVQNHLLLRPPNVERLIGFISLIAEKGLFLLCLHEGGVRIQSSLPLRMPSLDGSHKVLVRPPQSLEVLVGCRNEGFARLTSHLFPRIMESFEVAE